ncbi:MAG: energy-coupling factor transporter transmembrane component T [Phycisphaerales bacterium]
MTVAAPMSTARPASRLARLDARVKILCAASWAACVVSIPRDDASRFAIFAVAFSALLALEWRGANAVLRRVCAALPYIAIAAIALPFLSDGVVVARFGPISATREGLGAAMRVGCAGVLCLGMVSFVAAMSTEHELVRAARGLGVPQALADVVALCARYLPAMRRAYAHMRTAAAARSAQRDFSPRDAGWMLGALALRTHARALSVGHAMASRGFGACDGSAPRRVPPADLLVGALAVAGMLVLRFA